MSERQSNIPFVSVVICTYNRDKYIEGALHSLIGQTAASNEFEVLVIDNRSTDDTRIICQRFINAHPFSNIHYFYEAAKGLSAARNRGWHEAKGEIISYIDDDAEAIPEFVETVRHFFSNNVAAVGAGGRIIPKYESGEEPAWMSSYLNGFVGRVDFGEKSKVFSGAMKYPAGCNMIYRKAVLEAAGGFNNDLTFRSDDKYIYYAVSKISNQVYYLPHAIVYHNIDNERLQFSGFKKLFLKTGNEEKVRLRSEGGSLGKKLLELFLKLGASVLLYFKFLITGAAIKGKYVVMAQWFTLKGFLQKDVFVR